MGFQFITTESIYSNSMPECFSSLSNLNSAKFVDKYPSHFLSDKKVSYYPLKDPVKSKDDLFNEKIKKDINTIQSLGYSVKEIASQMSQLLSGIEKGISELEVILKNSGLPTSDKIPCIFYATININNNNSVKTEEIDFAVIKLSNNEEKFSNEPPFDQFSNPTHTYVIKRHHSNDIYLNSLLISYINEFGLFINPNTIQEDIPLEIISLLTNRKVKNLTTEVKKNTPILIPVHSIKPLPYYKTFKNIDSIQAINNISLEEIERRARPNAYSQCGFINNEESLQNLITEDLKTIHQLGTSCEELAAHLKNIIEIAYSNRFAETISYDPSILENNTFLPGNRIFKAALISTRGYQHDIFSQKIISDFNLQNYFKEDGGLHPVSIPHSWSDEPRIMNISNHEELTVTRGSIAYLEELGFCGGHQNPFRIDPKAAYRLLSEGITD